METALDEAPASLPAELAWCHVQIGGLYFSIGDFDHAQKEYDAALEEQANCFAALERLAELHAARGQFDAARGGVQGINRAHSARGSVQTLGDLYLSKQLAAEAAPWHARALASYLKAATEGNAHYYHHLAGFFCDAQPNPAEALKWARKDMEIRHNSGAYDALAWALYKNGDYKEAAEAMTKALEPGVKDAHIYFHAGTIFFRAGDVVKSRACMKEALTINPHFEKFHAHR